ncbi:sugar ABC transporter permease [Nocardioides sp. GY 10127]|uniref:carbohydrate ABC transporter permease n=1 Tax=Nocardioides sp. GY 10127 TaxID=2569762 RepID=UPI0010A8AAA3|nr:sugar ABC transporter permease [Nocardioides sp. GY 10127]TIC82754.1 sugar ABC transporter permease [Nocardioides sp. GY 10127]
MPSVTAPRSTAQAVEPAGSTQVDPAPRHRERHLFRLWFALPAMALVTFFFLTPFVANAVLSFMQWTGFSSTISFNGLANFRSLMALGILGHATWVTIAFAVTTMLTQNVIGLALAKALQETNRVNSIYRSVFFLPVLMSPLAAGFIWAAILSDHGPVNQFLGLLAGHEVAYSWLGHPVSALLTVGIIDGWKWSGLVTLVYIAGLNTIPRTVREAALLDGAGPWRRFVGIEMPLLAPAFTFNLVLTLVGSFSALDVIFATTKGGPGTATSVLNVAVFNQYGMGLFGTSSALSFMIAILVIVTAVPMIWFLRRREVHG